MLADNALAGNPKTAGRPAPLQSRTITINQLEWHYPQDSIQNNTAAAVTFEVTNHARGKSIRSVRFRMMAFDKRKVVLQSDGATLKQLVHTGAIQPEETKTIQFEEAFRNPSVDSIAVVGATVEFMNGSLEVLER